MAQKIAFANNKGGTAKTTSLVNIAGALHLKQPNAKILIIDTDGQGNAARSFNIDANDSDLSMYGVFMGQTNPVDAIYPHVFDNIDMIMGNNDLNYLEFDKMKKLSTESDSDLQDQYFNMLNGVIKRPTNDTDESHQYVDEMYDFIFFDTPPEMKAVTSSVLATSDYVIIPYEPDSFSIDGIVNIIERISDIRQNYNPDLKIGGLLATKYQRNTKIAPEVVMAVQNYANDHGVPFFSNYIPRSTTYAKSPAYKGLPATLSLGDNRSTRKRNPLTDAYFDLLDEMIAKNIIKID